MNLRQRLLPMRQNRAVRAISAEQTGQFAEFPNRARLSRYEDIHQPGGQSRQSARARQAELVQLSARKALLEGMKLC
jgi:hypothetical protein